MAPRTLIIGITTLQLAAFFILTFADIHAQYLLEIPSTSMNGTAYRATILEFLQEYLNTPHLLISQLMEVVFVYLPPAFAAFKMPTWRKFHIMTLSIAFILAIISLLQMFAWEMPSRGGCNGCVGLFYLQIIFDFFVFVAVIYRRTFYGTSKNP